MVTISAAKEGLLALLQNQNQPSVCTHKLFDRGFQLLPMLHTVAVQACITYMFLQLPRTVKLNQTVALTVGIVFF